MILNMSQGRLFNWGNGLVQQHSFVNLFLAQIHNKEYICLVTQYTHTQKHTSNKFHGVVPILMWYVLILSSSIRFHFITFKRLWPLTKLFYDPLIGCGFQCEKHWSIIFFLEHWESSSFVCWPGTLTIIYNVVLLQKYILSSEQVS